MYADREEEAIRQRRSKGRPSGGSSSGRRRAPSSSVSPVSRSSSVSRSVSRSPPPTPGGASRRRSPSPARNGSRRRRPSFSDTDSEDERRDRLTREKRSKYDKDAENGRIESHEELRRRALLSRNARAKASPDPPPRSSRASARDASEGSSLSARLDRDRSRRDSERRRDDRGERRRGRDLLDSGRHDTPRKDARPRRPLPEDLSEEETYEQRRRRGSGRARHLEHDDEAYARRSRLGSAPRSRASGSHYDSEDDLEDTRSRGGRGRDTYDHRRGPPGYDRYPYYGAPRDYYDPYGRPPPRYDPRPAYDYYDRPPRRYTRSPSLPPRDRRAESRPKSTDPADYENRSIFCSQLAARLTQRDLGEFFEDKLGEGTVEDVRIVMDKITGRSKGIGYVELRDESLVEKALALSNTVVFGIPILVQKTDAARNRGSVAEDTPARPNMPGATTNGAIHLDPNAAPSAASRLYVGNLHFNLTDENVRTVFEPFGSIISVDLHREPGTQKSKGFAFVQYISVEDAEKAIQHMNGFELAGRNIRVGHVNAAKMDNPPSLNSGSGSGAATSHGVDDAAGAQATITSSFDEGGGGGLNASSRAALMEKLARVDKGEAASQSPSEQQRPTTIPQASSRGVLVRNMFSPEEETERGWDTELAEDVKDECEAKYGKVDAIKVDPNSQGEVWIRFAQVECAQKAVAGLNGRFFGGRSIQAAHVNEGILGSMLG